MNSNESHNKGNMDMCAKPDIAITTIISGYAGRHNQGQQLQSQSQYNCDGFLGHRKVPIKGGQMAYKDSATLPNNCENNCA